MALPPIETRGMAQRNGDLTALDVRYLQRDEGRALDSSAPTGSPIPGPGGYGPT
jgi:hypothetical protein